MRIFFTSRISWNRISDWLPVVFHFGTENWEEQLKKTPCIYQRFLLVSNLSEIICALLCVTRSSLNREEPAAADDDHDDRGGRLSSGLETRNRLLLYNTTAMPRTFFFFPLSTLLHSPPVAGGTCLRARRVVSVRAGVLVRTRSASTAP